ncbi:MAG: methylated-DNA--[protein]-cysteine S-methyltransferase [Bacteroidetes bacterium]|nr:methylated-DNA--[protein]-cysteine S-methyltransferase [Bacteroidota bacterium]
MFQCVYRCKLGNLLLKSNDEALTEICFDVSIEGKELLNPVLEKTMIQLDEYFNLQRTIFTIPLATEGTPFQISVWNELQKIPFGKQISYSQLSKQMQQPLAIRAIASANGKNPIPIIIPCHRVVGKNGELVGFSGGLWRKKLLLDLEGNTLFTT